MFVIGITQYGLSIYYSIGFTLRDVFRGITQTLVLAIFHDCRYRYIHLRKLHIIRRRYVSINFYSGAVFCLPIPPSLIAEYTA